MFRNWTVMENPSGHRAYFYGPISDYAEEDLGDYNKVVEPEDYSSDDMVEIFGNVLEDNNYHKVTSLGNEVLRSLKETTSLDEEELRKFLRHFITNFILMHNLR